MADIFVSYSREDSDRVRLLLDVFKQFGLTVAYDQLFEREENFEKRILKEIVSAGVVVVCWSDAASRSEWVLDEAREAKRRGKYLGCQIAAGGAGFRFDSINHDDLTRWQGDTKDLRFLAFFSELGRRIRRDEIAGLEEAERERLDRDKRAREAIETQKRREQEIEAAKKAARVAAERHREQERQRREAERLRSFWERITPSDRTQSLIFWWSPAVAAFALMPFGLLLFYFHTLYCGLIPHRAWAIAALWFMIFFSMWITVGFYGRGAWCEGGALCGFQRGMWS